MRQLTSDGWRSLLYLFVADEEEMRPVMMKPFEQRGYVCASDMHILIRVAKKYISDDYSTEAKTPDVGRIFTSQTPKFTLTLEELEKALTILGIDYSLTSVFCTECANDCEVQWEYTDKDGDKHTMWAECPCCNGTGDVPNGANKYCEIGDKKVLAYYMILLRKVMMELEVYEVKVSIGDLNPIKFSIEDGIDIVVMPCILDKYSSKQRTQLMVTKL